MTQVLLLNGPAGVGKTTVAAALADGVRPSVVIAGDEMRDWVVHRHPAAGVDPAASGLTYLGGGLLASMYAEAGYKLVVFEFVFEQPQALARWLGGYTASASVHLCTLWAPLDLVVRREAGRTARAPLGQQVRRCWERMDAHKDALGHLVDATDAADLVAARVAAALAAGHGLVQTS